MTPENPALQRELAEEEAAWVVSRLRFRVLAATTNEAYLERRARVFKRLYSESFVDLPPSQQLELLLAMFDRVGQGDLMRDRADRLAREWRESPARRASRAGGKLGGALDPHWRRPSLDRRGGDGVT